MPEETQMAESVKFSRKRKIGHKKGGKAKKKQKQFVGMKEKVRKVRINPKLKKMLQKKARDYNSDEDDDDEDEKESDRDENEGSLSDENREDIENDDDDDDYDDEDGEIQPGVTKFSEGCRAFRVAFKSIMKKKMKKGEAEDPLGPVLSVHKKLLAEKLAEEETERKDKGKAKKEKQLVGEKGHVKPEKNFLDSREKVLIGVATKGVVKLFNAVNKAQHAQKGLNPLRSKDAKVIKERKKEAFFSELGKTPAADVKAHTFSGAVESEGPSWAPLRDNYMLTSSKLKDWDKMPDKVAEDDIGRISEDSSSDDE